MISFAQQLSQENEHDALADLRAHYLARGYSFVDEPQREQLPAFFGSYVPDAIASKPGANVAIELKRTPKSASEQKLEDIRRLFEGHPDWQFVVANVGSDRRGSATIPASSPEKIIHQMDEIRELVKCGQNRAAFVMAWSLMEAVVHYIEGAGRARPLLPGTVLQSLAMLGHIDSALESEMRSLIGLRNRIVHGDLGAEPSLHDIELILSAVEQSLKEEG